MPYYDSEAIELFEDAATLLKAALGPGTYGEIGSALTNYMLGDALEVLRAAMARTPGLNDTHTP